MLYFKNPLFLYLLSSLIVLIIFHLIKKRKIKVVEFSSIIFILKSHKKISKKLKIKQFFLFLIRLLFLLFLVFLLSNSFFVKNNKGTTLVKDKPRLIILDNNYQMLLKTDDLSDFEIGKNMLKEYFQQGGQNQYLFFENEKINITTNSQIEATLNKMEIVNNYENSSIAQYIKKMSEYQQMEIIFITNHFENKLDNIQYSLLEHKDVKNFFINGVEIRQIGVNQYKLTAKIKSGSTKTYSTTISLLNEDKKLSNMLITLNSGEEKDLIFYFSAQNTSNKYKLLLEDDDLNYDNNYYFVVDSIKPSELLIINGDSNPISYKDESFYFINALKSSHFYFGFNITEKNSLDDVIFQNYDAVIFLNYSFNQIEYKAKLTEFIKSGKSIFISLGSNTDPLIFNNFWGELINLREFKDLTITKVFKNLAQFNNDYLFINKINLISSELMDFYVYKYFHIATEQNFTPIVSLNDGTPFLVEKKVENSKILLYLSSIDRDWNDIPLSTHYAPLIIQSITYLLDNNFKNKILTNSKYETIAGILSKKDFPSGIYQNLQSKNLPFNLIYKYSDFDFIKLNNYDSKKATVNLKNDKVLISLKNYLIYLLMFLLFVESFITFKNSLFSDKKND